MRSTPAVTARAEETAEVEDAKQKPIIDAHKGELQEADLEAVVGGIGSAQLGGGAGRN